MSQWVDIDRPEKPSVKELVWIITTSWSTPFIAYMGQGYKWYDWLDGAELVPPLAWMSLERPTYPKKKIVWE